MFWTRTISGAVLLAITIAMIVIGTPWLLLFVGAAGLIGLFELYRVFSMEKKLTAWVGYAAAVGIYLVIGMQAEEYLLAVITAAFLFLMSIYVFTYPKVKTEEITQAIFGVIYVPLMLSFVARTRMSQDGMYTVWLIFISAWGADTCAYLVGRAIGKHKMAPVLSPKKSVEGAVGGVVGAALLGVIYAIIFKENLTAFANPIVACACIGACGSPISMIGDLSASAIKRHFGIKDYGTLIPGHGGILDRFDSIIFTAPIIYYLVTMLQAI